MAISVCSSPCHLGRVLELSLVLLPRFALGVPRFCGYGSLEQQLLSLRSSWDTVSPISLENPDVWSPFQNTLPDFSQNQQITGHTT